jgi:hypothetical protein
VSEVNVFVGSLNVIVAQLFNWFITHQSDTVFVNSQHHWFFFICRIYECNSRCKCDSRCHNRVVQNGLSLKLQVFKTEKRFCAVISFIKFSVMLHILIVRV